MLNQIGVRVLRLLLLGASSSKTLFMGTPRQVIRDLLVRFSVFLVRGGGQIFSGSHGVRPLSSLGFHLKPGRWSKKRQGCGCLPFVCGLLFLSNGIETCHQQTDMLAPKLRFVRTPPPPPHLRKPNGAWRLLSGEFCLAGVKVPGA